MLKVYIVDDEPFARDELKYLLSRTRQVNILGESGSIRSAAKEIPELKPDLVFLDIELAGDSGLNLAKQLESLEPSPAVVFATAYDEYAVQAFDLNAVDYVLKPFDEDRIQKTLDKVKKIREIENKTIPFHPSIKNERSGKIAVPVDDRIVLLSLSDIQYLESFEGKTKIKTVKQEYTVNEALVLLEKKLSENQFLRVHRSYIVNMDFIVEIEPWFNSTFNLILKDGSKVPVSRTYVKDMKNLLGI
ncbi:LytR/AlgR family response regulator transcription factor [Bacillus litorisediminis]|uniref:LytR/AlgR family response regulator transcription factor n=1 Tax=Bacillus litorisediminis TaxID=2922713 RepID=UPI001FAB3E9C|nr:LytTR family DNA-binding domain-containing protein [Bacillus litorisediminis]